MFTKSLVFLSALKKKISNFFSILSLVEENWRLKKQLSLPNDPRAIVNQCFSKGIAWYDWNDEKEVPLAQRKENYHDAQMILHAPIFSNIKNFLVATGAQTALLEEQLDTRKIRDFQMTINGLELLEKELQNITNPDVPKERVVDPFAGV